MNTEKYLVLIKKQDKTEDIIKYYYQNGLVNIIFHSSEQEYTYSKRDFEFYKDPTEIDLNVNDIVIQDEYIFNFKKILFFHDYYKIFFKDNTTRVVPGYLVEKLPKDTNKKISNNIFEYFKEVSKIVGIKTEDGTALITKEYKKINFINKNTALYSYLNPQKYINGENIENKAIIYPFGANKSQLKAVKRAMENQISIIEGPPGTGKTQTILNIIANIVKSGQTVAIVSNNNSATENVYEKLQKYGLDFLCAQLGKKENKINFIKEQTGKYPKFENELKDSKNLEQKIIELNNEIVKIFSLRNRIAVLKDELSQIQTQRIYFNNQEGKELNNMPKIKSFQKVSSAQIMSLKVECENLEADNRPISLLFKIKSIWVYGIGNIKFYNKNIKYIMKIFDKLFFIAKEHEINEEIKGCTKQLQTLKDENKLEKLTEYSMKIFKDFLGEKYNREEKRKIFKIEDLSIQANQFNEEYPIILSTTHSIKNCLKSNYVFDYIIMDEASQVDLITGILAISSAKNAVIVGDLKQLPNVITTQNQSKIVELSKKYNIGESYDYLNNSFLSSISTTIKKAPHTLLQEHYRCHPKIIGFCNKKFYDNQLIIMTEDKGEDDILKAIITPEGKFAREHYNQRQIDIIEKEILPELSDKVDNQEVGIISPYRDQKNNLEKKIDKVQIDTVHKFQGREKEAIVITTVDNEISEFVDDPKMLNVAITRAKRYLRVVVSGNKENEGTNIDDLIKYIQYNNFEVKESQTKSIYDLLYKQNRKQRMEYLKRKKKVSEYDSENLTYGLIEDIIKENNYNNLDIAVHVPLSDLLKNWEKLEEKERNFVNNTWTHIDFVIFNKMDKKMVIAVEVDGYFYHKEGTTQERRDRLKDKILAQYDIPLLRLNTLDSDEKEKLSNEMEKVFR